MRYRLKPALSTRKVADEVFVYDRDKGGIHTFNGTGAFLWDLVHKSVPVAEMATSLENAYEVAAETAQEDVLQFLLSLEKASLLEWEER